MVVMITFSGFDVDEENECPDHYGR